MLRTILLVFLALVLGGRDARAQSDEAPADPLGPVQCYLAADAVGLERVKAKDLCLGAASAAPAQCFDAAASIGFSDLYGVDLCRTARSDEPARCADRLDDTTTLDRTNIVSYCAATGWPLTPARSAGAPACLEAALDRTDLADSEAARLCRGSRSTDPVSCYGWGEDTTTMSDSDLVDLCTRVVLWAPGLP